MVDSHSFIDTVQVEKANAIARYHRFQKLAKLLQVFEVVLVLSFLSWSSTCIPAAVETVKIFSKYVVEVFIYILNPHVIFLLGNAIVFALYLLSRQIDIGNSSEDSEFYNEDFIDLNETRLPTAAAEAIPLAEEMIGEEKKQIVYKENVISETENAPIKELEQSVEEVIGQAVEKETKKLERTMSGKLQRGVLIKPKKELRRSETEGRQVIVASGHRQMSRFERVDTLSSEDFRLTVEAFIEKQQKFLRQQRVAEIGYC